MNSKPYHLILFALMLNLIADTKSISSAEKLDSKKLLSTYFNLYVTYANPPPSKLEIGYHPDSKLIDSTIPTSKTNQRTKSILTYNFDWY